MEQKAITKYIEDKIGGKARLLKISPIPDDSLGKAMRFTIIAAGFDLPGNSVYQRAVDEPLIQQSAPSRPTGTGNASGTTSKPAASNTSYGYGSYLQDSTPQAAFTPSVTSAASSLESTPEEMAETEIFFEAPAPVVAEEDVAKSLEKEIWREEDTSAGNARMIQEFIGKLDHPDQGWEADLETPAYIRQNIPLADLTVILRDIGNGMRGHTTDPCIVNTVAGLNHVSNAVRKMQFRCEFEVFEKAFQPYPVFHCQISRAGRHLSVAPVGILPSSYVRFKPRPEPGNGVHPGIAPTNGLIFQHERKFKPGRLPNESLLRSIGISIINRTTINGKRQGGKTKIQPGTHVLPFVDCILSERFLKTTTTQKKRDPDRQISGSGYYLFKTSNGGYYFRYL
ncbi:hypothetical protein COLO4_01831 [Corchorus olitorius]|uniref:Uncharacterized protein n=1 Tax=Corchorus olitorius TaxID=93759 RepID=A0A1R3L248_9ROSI|nr:hypothetical protein COLO4_01831 [Corchorus olitorius]